jgi:shikimate 5-dehydrogenase
VAARRGGEAEALAGQFGATTHLWTDPEPASLVIHATLAGMAGAESIGTAVEGWMAPGGRVIDFVYAADDPVIATAAEKAGTGYEDGWRLLVYQAIESYRIWWGAPPSQEIVDRQLKDGGCAA